MNLNETFFNLNQLAVLSMIHILYEIYLKFLKYSRLLNGPIMYDQVSQIFILWEKVQCAFSFMAYERFQLP